MELTNSSSTIQHDLRKEFHNMLGILKIIKNEHVIQDPELNDMINICLERESGISQKFEALTFFLESKDE